MVDFFFFYLRVITFSCVATPIWQAQINIQLQMTLGKSEREAAAAEAVAELVARGTWHMAPPNGRVQIANCARLQAK